MAEGPAEKDSVVGAWFGIDFGEAVQGAFRECTGMGSESEVVEDKKVGPKGLPIIKKVPGNMKWNNITLKRGLTGSMDMWKWRQMVEEGKIKEARKNGTITMYDQHTEPIAKWDFVNAWPCKLTGPSANATANEVAIEELEITHEGYKRSQ